MNHSHPNHVYPSVCKIVAYLTAGYELFSSPNHFEQSHEKRKKIISDFPHLESSHFRKKQAVHPCQKVVNGQAPGKKKITMTNL
jgi:hypothetical protein